MCNEEKNNNDELTIGHRMRLVRGSLSQKNFGEAIGFSRTYIADVEGGRTKPSRKMIESVCREFSVSADWILGGNSRVGLLEREKAGATSTEAKEKIVDDLLEAARETYERLGEILSSLRDKDKSG